MSEPPGSDTTSIIPGVNAAESDDPEMLTLLNDEDPTDAYGENIGINGLAAPAVMNTASSATLIPSNENPFSDEYDGPPPESIQITTTVSSSLVDSPFGTTVTAGQIGVTEA